MRQARPILGVVVIMLSGMLAVGGQATTGQEATPAAGDQHPIVGSWLLDTNVDDPANAPTLAVFTADGVYFQAEPVTVPDAASAVSVGVGSWEPTGDTTADMTFIFVTGPDVKGVIRASVDVPDGRSFTGTYTVEFINPDGTSTGEIGPGRAEGTRIAVEPQGIPIGSFEDVFGAPEATPAG